MKQSFLHSCIILVVVFFGSTCCITKENCTILSKKDCRTCLSVTGCAFCTKDKSCFLYGEGNILNTPCSVEDMKWQTCVANFQTWIIVVSVIAGVLLIAILIAIGCVCRKCKRCSIRKEERRQARDQKVEDERMAERQAAAEARTTDRNRVADQIRMKYGILKEKENGTDYARME